MSTRAYQIQRVSQYSSFNLTYNELLRECLELSGVLDDEKFTLDGVGIITIDKEYDLPKVVKKFQEIRKNYIKEQIRDFQEAIEQIKEDIENTDYKDFAFYHCY